MNWRKALRTVYAVWAFLLLLGFGSVLLVFAIGTQQGCVANSGDPAVVRLDRGSLVDIRDAIHTEVSASVIEIKKTTTDQSQKTAEVSQQAQTAISKIDQSTSDKVVNRLLVSGMVLVLVLLAVTYPAGKLIWLIGARLRNGRKRTRKG